MDKSSNLSPEKQALLEQRLKGASVSAIERPEIPRRPDRDSALLSFAQRQMWVIDRMAPGNPAYNLPVGYRIKGALDARALENSLNEAIKRHESLRTTVVERDGEPVQVIHPELRVQIKITELDHLAAEERESRLHALASEESVKPFDLSNLPLFRASLFKLGEAEHVLIVTLHHVIADGLSVGLLFSEVDTFYRIFTGGTASRPSDLVVQYADFALWQRSAIAAGLYASQVDYWRNQLSGKLPVLELPWDKSRPALQSFKGSNVFFDIPRALLQDLNTLSSREGCTLFMTLLAAFQVLLQRYSGAEDVVVGTPVARRTPSEVEPLIGNCLNMAALRCDISGNPTFVELLRRSRDLALNGFSNTDLPFEALVEHLKFERDPSRNPIFQVMLQVLPAAASRIGNLELSSFHFDLKIAQLDLSLHLYEEAGGYLGRLEYCTDLFEVETVKRLSSSFTQLLQAVVTNPQQRISTIPILAESERRQMLNSWNNTSREYPKDLCLHHLLEKTARESPSRIAVEYDGRTLTYGELNTKANRLAHHLINSGVKPESLVGIYLERSLDLIVGLLGILKAGAAYVPMDPSFPPDRLAYMAEDAGIEALVTQTDLLKAFPRAGWMAVCLDADGRTIQQERADNPNLSLRSSNLAYAIYTSGSTGQPKGVMIEHRSLVNALTSMQREPGFDQDDILVAVTTISFDIAALEIFLPLISGGKLVIADKNEALDGSLLLPKIARSRATALQATPATWKLMIQAGWKQTPNLKMLCGGEALPRELANQMLERGGELWNMYGPTETTIWSSVRRIKPGHDPILIGAPIANTQFYIVDKELEPVPIGVAGELLIGGDGVARGYLNRPDLTAERFIESPFLSSGNRVYKAGDLARFRPDGSVEFLGRLDFQVKLRGYRIELGEIEHALARHESIKNAAVVIWEDQDGDKRLAAYYIPVAPGLLNAGHLRKALQGKLPDYMIPSSFIEMGAFPLTANGKIDRKAFPKPENLEREEDAGHVPPEGERELQLAELWEKALKKRPIGANDNFFELGGHSLLAAQVFAQIERKLGVRLPLAILLQAPTIRQLAGKIEQKVGGSRWNSLVPIRTQGDRPPLFLVHGAEGNVLLYANLARKLGANQPLYGLQSRGLDGREPIDTTIESMAARYLEEIKSVQSEGPYYLGGYCMGGLIAFETAQQLKKAGESVALLAMFETYNLENRLPLSLPLTGIHKAQNIYFQLRNLWLSLAGGAPGFFSEKLKVELGRFKVKVDILRSRIFNKFNSRRPLNYQHLQIQAVNDRAQAAYRPGSYDGQIILFRTKSHYQAFNDWYFGWEQVAKQGVEVVEMLNYPRGSLNDPFVGAMASRLEAEIEKAIARAHSLVARATNAGHATSHAL